MTKNVRAGQQAHARTPRSPPQGKEALAGSVGRKGPHHEAYDRASGHGREDSVAAVIVAHPMIAVRGCVEAIAVIVGDVDRPARHILDARALIQQRAIAKNVIKRGCDMALLAIGHIVQGLYHCLTIPGGTELLEYALYVAGGLGVALLLKRAFKSLRERQRTEAEIARLLEEVHRIGYGRRYVVTGYSTAPQSSVDETTRSSPGKVSGARIEHVDARLSRKKLAR